NVRTVNGVTTVSAGNGADTINVGSQAAGTLANPNNNAGGTVDSISAALTLNGGNDGDTLNVDDSGDGNSNTGRLTSTTITELDMLGSISYFTMETLTIGLGTNADTFTIESTHANVTTLHGN